MPAVRIVRFRPECGDFDLETFPEHGDGAVLDARRDDAMEEFDDLLGTGIGRNIVVAYFPAKEIVAKRASDKVGALARAGEYVGEIVELAGRAYLCHKGASIAESRAAQEAREGSAALDSPPAGAQTPGACKPSSSQAAKLLPALVSLPDSPPSD